MAELILGLWILQALLGAYMWSFTLGVGRPESTARVSSLPAPILFLHPFLALTGLVIWVAYLYSDAHALTWVAFGVLLVVAGLGDVMALRTFRHRRDQERGAVPPRLDPGHTAAETAVANQTIAEKQIPVPVILLHGLNGLTIIALVLVKAITGD